MNQFNFFYRNKGLMSLLLISILCLAGRIAAAATYYIDPLNGNDNKTKNSGTSPSSAWKTTLNINGMKFGPGNQILIRRGTTLYGQIKPLSGSNGILTNPIIIDAYTGSDNSTVAPVIDASNVPTGIYNNPPSTQTGCAGIWLEDCSGWTIQNITVRNRAGYTTVNSVPEKDTGQRGGIWVTAKTGMIKNIIIRHCRIKNIENVWSLYTHVGHNYFVDGIDAGIWVGAEFNYSHLIYGEADYPFGHDYGYVNTPTMSTGYVMDSVQIDSNYVDSIGGYGISVFYNPGSVSVPLCEYVRIIGNIVDSVSYIGILCQGTHKELIQGNIVDHFGYKAPNDGGTHGCAGIEPQIHKGGVIQYNEVRYGDFHGYDGGAFDNDLMLDSTVVFQYNYSHDNAGGFFEDIIPNSDGSNNPQAVVRYNISVNDGASYANNQFIISNRNNGAYYNNTFYNTSPTAYMLDLQSTGNTFTNNIFDGINGAAIHLNPSITSESFSAQTFTTNYYASTTGFIGIPPAIDTGFSSTQCFRLQFNSPCINTGVSITTDNNTQDFWGTRLYVGAPDIGAYENFDLSGDVAIEKIPATGQLVCFARGNDNTIHYRVQNTAGANNDWPQDWKSLGDTSIGSIAAIKGYGNDLYVFAKNSHNVLRYRRLPSGSTVWNDWKTLPQLPSGNVIGSKIAAAVDPSNKIVIFAKGLTNNYLYRLYQTGTNTFYTTWAQLGGNTAVGNNIVAIGQEAFSGAGKLQLFANRLSDNAVVTLYQTTAGSSGSWIPSYVNLLSNAQDGLAVAKNANGVIQIFANTTQATSPPQANYLQIASCYQNGPTTWSYWQNLVALGSATMVAAGKNYDGRLELFFWGYRGMLDHTWQNSVNSYTSWSGSGYYIGPTQSNPSNFIGVINNTASNWNFSLFICNSNNGANSVGSSYQDMNSPGGWAPFFEFIN